MVPSIISSKLSGLRRWEACLRLLWGLTRWLALIVGLLTLACLVDFIIDRYYPTPWPLRVALVIGQVAAGLIGVVVWLMRPLATGLSDAEMALQVEEKYPTLCHRLISVVQFERPDANLVGMSTALITTLYGAILAYLVFHPVKRKLEDRDNAETLVKEIMIEGILSIQSGDNPRILEEKLLCFLPPIRREAVRQEAARE